MGRRSLWIWIALGAAVVVLVTLNLAMQGENEPRSEAMQPRRPSAVDRAPEPEPEPTEAAAAEPATEARAAAGCEHPLIPSMPGEWRRYRAASQTHDDPGGSGELTIEAMRARELDDGDREITWRVRVTLSEDGSERADARLTTRCTPGRDAEEPWFGIVDVASGRSFMRGSNRWRWPVELTSHAAIAGTAVLRLSDAEVAELGAQFRRTGEHATRRHTVGAREEVRVPAGRFDAWRIEYEEERALADHVRTGTGTLWIAPDAGLVRSRAQTARGGTETMELVAMGRREE